MTTLTKEEREAIDSMEVKPADVYCNARKSDGNYCKMRAGTRTSHLGSGRCFLHGGSSDGRPIVHGFYSKKLRSKLAEDYQKVIEDPTFINLYTELAVIKTIFGEFLEHFSAELEKSKQEDKNFWVEISEKGTPMLNPEARNIFDMLEAIGKIYTRIVDAEVKSKQTLTIKQVMLIIQQIKQAMNVCGHCPIRSKVVGNFDSIRSPGVEL